MPRPKTYKTTLWPLQTHVARFLGISHSSLSDYVKKKGWSKRGTGTRPALTKEQLSDILEHYSKAVPAHIIELAKKLFLYGEPVPYQSETLTNNDNDEPQYVSPTAQTVTIATGNTGPTITLYVT